MLDHILKQNEQTRSVESSAAIGHENELLTVEIEWNRVNRSKRGEKPFVTVVFTTIIALDNRRQFHSSLAVIRIDLNWKSGEILVLYSPLQYDRVDDVLVLTGFPHRLIYAL